MKKGIIYVVAIVLVLIIAFYLFENKKAVAPVENQNIGMNINR